MSYLKDIFIVIFRMKMFVCFFFLDCIQTYLVTKHILDLGGVQLKHQKCTLVSLYAMSPQRMEFYTTPVCDDKVCAGLFPH